jgi:hypothetical protein
VRIVYDILKRCDGSKSNLLLIGCLTKSRGNKFELKKCSELEKRVKKIVVKHSTQYIISRFKKRLVFIFT